MTRFIPFIALLLALFAAPALAQQAQTASGNNVVTILVSIDGFRPDYLERGITPHLSRLRDEGVSAAMRPSFPTKTFPNHVTIVTGLRPDRHGIVGNSMIDPTRPGVQFSLGDPRQALDPFWWAQAEPIWITAERAGIRTATMFWPGSEVLNHDRRPSDWLRYDQNIGHAQRVDTVIDWLRRPVANRARFITTYFDTVDTAGHRFGPDSAEVNAAISDVDTAIGRMIAGAAELGRHINLVIVADHGMMQVSADRVIQLDTLIDHNSIIGVEVGPYAAIEPAAGTDDRAYDELLRPHDHMNCHRKEDLPERLHYGRNPRVAAIICLAAPGWTILWGQPQYPVTGGAHGYDNVVPEMNALFLAHGPAFRRGVRLPTFDNVQVYPLLARLIGVPPLAGDGDNRLTEAAIVPSSAR
jgi:predicted AlkP superfamily pyrophosphatase or phosphodiesterase